MNKSCEKCQGTFSTRSIRARWCESCRPTREQYLLEWRARNCERLKRNDANRYQRNIESATVTRREYYKNNREKILSRSKKRYAANPDKVKSYVANWAKKNKDKRSRYTSKWTKNNLDKANAAWHRRRARLKGNGGSHTPEEIEAILISQGFCCAGCSISFTKRKPTIDHIIPVSRGGTDDPSNLQLLCQPCNSSKGTRTNHEWKAA